jgi:multidrug efflux pump
MTSISTILGLLPLALASGEGANGRIAMGTAVIGGLLISTMLTLFLIPAMYIYLSTDRKSAEEKKNGNSKAISENELTELN